MDSTSGYVTSQKVRVTYAHEPFDPRDPRRQPARDPRDAAARPPGRVSLWRRGAAGRPHPRDHRPLAAMGPGAREPLRLRDPAGTRPARPRRVGEAARRLLA